MVLRCYPKPLPSCNWRRAQDAPTGFFLSPRDLSQEGKSTFVNELFSSKKYVHWGNLTCVINEILSSRKYDQCGKLNCVINGILYKECSN